MTDQVAPLLCRVDSNSKIGAGHFMRCLALANAYKNIGGSITFVCKDIQPECESFAKKQEVELVHSPHDIGSRDDANFLVELANQASCSEVITDGYFFDADYRRALRNKKISVVAIDDGDLIPDETDLVINQNAHAEQIKLNSEEVDLLGLRYCLLGSRFWPYLNWSRKTADSATRFLVCFGGGDHLDWIKKSIAAIFNIVAKCEIRAVGADESDISELLAGATENQSIECIRHSDEIERIMAWADIAIGASGSMTWERAFMQLPSISIALAQNQQPLGETINQKQIGVHIGSAETVTDQQLREGIERLVSDIELRNKMALNGRTAIDGYGCDRVVQALSRQPVRLRRAVEADKQILFEWVNEPKVREMSFTKVEISWETHCDWFEKRVNNEDCLLFIAHDKNDECVGQVRFEIDQDFAEVSISVSSKFRGRGLSRAILAQGMARAKRQKKIKRINAFIQPGNKPSIQLFRGEGFTPLPATSINGFPALLYVYENESKI